ncbi:hypothetical protein TNCT_3651 [Trichonephila clavata]|uniref:Uncharacterized protein n=1 Tax=Trichonephila clavata TaxID=2740835 RepID=A0A8X6IU28_TRICU|nr:hypothetical protein TNCT_3651 [Trichonephila clavata]
MKENNLLPQGYARNFPSLFCDLLPWFCRKGDSNEKKNAINKRKGATTARTKIRMERETDVMEKLMQRKERVKQKGKSSWNRANSSSNNVVPRSKPHQRIRPPRN